MGSFLYHEKTKVFSIKKTNNLYKVFWPNYAADFWRTPSNVSRIKFFYKTWIIRFIVLLYLATCKISLKENVSNYVQSKKQKGIIQIK